MLGLSLWSPLSLAQERHLKAASLNMFPVKLFIIAMIFCKLAHASDVCPKGTFETLTFLSYFLFSISISGRQRVAWGHLITERLAVRTPLHRSLCNCGQDCLFYLHGLVGSVSDCEFGCGQRSAVDWRPGFCHSGPARRCEWGMVSMWVHWWASTLFIKTLTRRTCLYEGQRVTTGGCATCPRDNFQPEENRSKSCRVCTRCNNSKCEFWSLTRDKSEWTAFFFYLNNKMK